MRKKISFEKWLCIISYAIVPIFFLILYFLMTETYEDLYQYNVHAEAPLSEIVNNIYNYLPRIGEFYQRIAVHFMTPQVTFGPDMVFRTLNALMVTGVIYFTTMFVLGRRPRLRCSDALIYLGIMLLAMGSMLSDVFTYRFSYVNNYGLGILITIWFMLLFRLPLNEYRWVNKWYGIVLVTFLGFLFGITTEIAPVAVLILILCWTIAKLLRKEYKWRDLWVKYKVQLFAVIGVFLGLLFFYMGAGLGSRVGGMYAQQFEMVALSGFFSEPVHTLSLLANHLWFNLQYVWFAFPMMLTFILVEATLMKKDGREYFWWQVVIFGFCVLFMMATSLIVMKDGLFERMASPMLFAMILSIVLFVYHVINFAKIADKTCRAWLMIAIALNVILVVDMCVAFVRYNRLVVNNLDKIQFNPGEELIIEYDGTNEGMIPSPIFHLEQAKPWGW